MKTSTPLPSASAGTALSQARLPWRRVVLVVGDALSFLAFASAGRQSHSATDSIFAIAFPFALGWFVVSPFVGAFRQRVFMGVGSMLKWTELAWLCAWPVALLLRWAIWPDHSVPLSFAIVVLLANAVFLGIWRAVFAGVLALLARRQVGRA